MPKSLIGFLSLARPVAIAEGAASISPFGHYESFVGDRVLPLRL